MDAKIPVTTERLEEHFTGSPHSKDMQELSTKQC